MTKRQFVQELRSEYCAKGFQELEARHVAQMLCGEYRPDLAFEHGEEVHVIEIKSAQSPQTAAQIRKHREIVEKRPNWTFRFMVVPKRQSPSPKINADDDVQRRLAQAREIARSDQELSVVQLGMVLEICLRRLLEARHESPSPDAGPMEMARSLRSLGELTDEDLRVLENGLQARNLAVHGFRLPRDKEVTQDLLNFTLDLCQRAGFQLAQPIGIGDKTGSQASGFRIRNHRQL